MPFVNVYDSKGCFFVRVPVDAAGEPILPRNVRRNTRLTQTGGRPVAEKPREPLQVKEAATESSYGSVDFRQAMDGRITGKYQARATMLFLVICCLEISDILFAVDSLGAIMARVNHLLLAYTAAVFAMRGLRATVSIIEVLVKLFTRLKCGDAVVLVFIGTKLICMIILIWFW